MTTTETSKLLSLISSTYRREFSGANDAELALQMGLWQKAFADTDYAEVLSAVQNYIFTDRTGFAPVIGKIKEMLEGGQEKKDVGALNRRPYPQSFIDAVHKFLAEEEAAGRYHRLPG